jgi:hypothetical protein
MHLTYAPRTLRSKQRSTHLWVAFIVCNPRRKKVSPFLLRAHPLLYSVVVVKYSLKPYFTFLNQDGVLEPQHHSRRAGGRAVQERLG